MSVATILVAGLALTGLDTRATAALMRGTAGYTSALQTVGRADAIRRPLADLRTPDQAAPATVSATDLPTGPLVPELDQFSRWYNPPGDQPPPLSSLRGKVVLIDFWTYSCVNCVRTLPYRRALYEMRQTVSASRGRVPCPGCRTMARRARPPGPPTPSITRLPGNRLIMSSPTPLPARDSRNSNLTLTKAVTPLLPRHPACD